MSVCVAVAAATKVRVIELAVCPSVLCTDLQHTVADTGAIDQNLLTERSFTQDNINVGIQE